MTTLNVRIAAGVVVALCAPLNAVPLMHSRGLTQIAGSGLARKRSCVQVAALEAG